MGSWLGCVLNAPASATATLTAPMASLHCPRSSSRGMPPLVGDHGSRLKRYLAHLHAPRQRRQGDASGTRCNGTRGRGETDRDPMDTGDVARVPQGSILPPRDGTRSTPSSDQTWRADVATYPSVRTTASSGKLLARSRKYERSASAPSQPPITKKRLMSPLLTDATTASAAPRMASWPHLGGRGQDARPEDQSSGQPGQAAPRVRGALRAARAGCPTRH